MRLLILVSLLIIFSFNSSAQSSDNIPFVDSLLSVLEQSDDPLTQVQAYSQICWIQRSRNPKMAIENGNKGLQVLNSHPELAYLKPELLNYVGLVNRNIGDYSNAINYYYEALELAEKQNNILQIAYSNNNLGGIFTLKGDYLNAIKHLEKATENFELIENYSGLGYACVNLGNLYRHNNDIKEAINYFEKAIVYKEMVSDSIGIGIVMNLQAITYYDVEEYQKAYSLFKKVTPIYQHNKDEKGLAVINNYLGLLEFRNKNYQSALAHYKKSKALNEEIEHKSGLATSLINMSLVYHKLGKTELAISKLDLGYQFAKEIGDKEEIAHAFENYSSIYHDLKNYKKAYEYQNKYTQAIINKNYYETRERLATLRINNEIEKRVLKNENLKIENESLNYENMVFKEYLSIYKYMLIVFGILLLGIIGLVIVLTKTNRVRLLNNSALVHANKQLSEANKTRDKFMSIIGHDLKSPFNSVLGLTSLLLAEWDSVSNDEKRYIINEVNITSNNLYELMDNLLIWAKNQSESIKPVPKEFNINEYLVDIYELYRNQASYKKIKITMEIGKEHMVFADPNMISTVLRNLISNALKFTSKGGKIKVELMQRDKELEFCITDNGHGLLPEDLKRILEENTHHSSKGTDNETGTGLGLLLVKEFVRLNNGVFWIESKVSIGSKFYFTLPYVG